MDFPPILFFLLSLGTYTSAALPGASAPFTLNPFPHPAMLPPCPAPRTHTHRRRAASRVRALLCSLPPPATKRCPVSSVFLQSDVNLKKEI